MSPRILSDARLNNRRKSCRLCVVVIYAFLAMRRKLALRFLCFGSKLKKYQLCIFIHTMYYESLWFQLLE